jgi:hypothetical protein
MRRLLTTITNIPTMTALYEAGIHPKVGNLQEIDTRTLASGTLTVDRK